MRIKVRNHALYFVGFLSYLVSLVPFHVDFERALLLLPVVLVDLPVLEYLQPKVMSLKMGWKDAGLSILAGFPYVFMISPLMVVPVFSLILSLLLFRERNAMLGNVMGTTFLTSLSLVWGNFVENPFLLPAVYWVLYTLTGALYVEYKVPFRNLDKRVTPVLWTVVLSVLTYLSLGSPLLLLSLVEPSLRFLNPGDKLKSPKEVSSMGRRIAKRDAVFLAILIVASVLSER
ncbi:hypothetical protein [Sulfuracidifex tepidarius]|uniref:Uncharacterized protein n=1 Tax=Sulfuracidifex tepidarius TaxID=1294262 RepID=A0A510E0T4_9CREN|nr:hypothetical protein [Sulfuracidifex tepidarius]BBG26082.1 hypothetical protein IC007_0587 [Sulfuracidifex tepidarius]